METLGNIQETLINNHDNNLKYYCKKCDYNTSRKSSYDRHTLSSKHQNCTIGNAMETNMCKKVQNVFFCKKCNKGYIDRSGLWKHKKVCNKYESTENVVLKDSIKLNTEELTKIVLDIVKSNQELQKQNIELQKQMIDVCKNSQIINNTMSNCNNNNKTFNLQVFLNETCKNAMNLSEFIENMTVELPDLENMGKLGYVEGVSSIIIKNLKALEITQRPIHCTDEKRETVMIKENNVWFKEGDDRENLRKIVSTVISKNLFLLAEYQEKYPDCNTYDSHRSDEYTKIIMETATNQAEKKKEKIFRRIAREVVIDKNIN
jgi:hypothetical protein